MATVPSSRAAKNKGQKTAVRQKDMSSESSNCESSNCMICDKVIKDQDSSNKGQDSIFCKGDCQGWLHRTCAGISKKAFNEATVSDQPFYCHYCRCNLQEEISLLNSTIVELKAELKAALKKTNSQKEESHST